MYGADVGPLLAAVVAEADRRGDAYVELGQLGEQYETELSAHGFLPLREADAELVPFVFAPLQKRRNHEYLGLYSPDRELRERLQRLTLRDVYFTTADSDRDRAARVVSLTWRSAA